MSNSIKQTIPETCAACEFITENTESIGPQKQFMCRRYPPQVTSIPLGGPGGRNTGMMNVGAFPPTQENSWCGEFKRRVKIV